MKLARFRLGSREHLGVVIDERELIPLDQVLADAPDLIPSSLLEINPDLQNLIQRKLESNPPGIPIESVEFLPPIQPVMILDFMSFESHFSESLGLVEKIELWRKAPIAYKKNPFSVIGHGQPIIYPSYTRSLDFEVELGIIIHKHAKNVPASRAYEYVLGYTVFNDVSARDVELREIMLRLGPFKSKDFDTAGPMGPWLVTRDQIPDPHDLEMELWVDGVLCQQDTTANMYWKIPQLIEYLSRDQTIYPGTLILSGTPPRKRLKLGRPGSLVEARISGIGTLRNRIVKAE